MMLICLYTQCLIGLSLHFVRRLVVFVGLRFVLVKYLNLIFIYLFICLFLRESSGSVHPGLAVRDLLDGDGALLAAVQDAGGMRRRGVLVSFQIPRIFYCFTYGRVKVNNSASGANSIYLNLSLKKAMKYIIGNSYSKFWFWFYFLHNYLKNQYCTVYYAVFDSSGPPAWCSSLPSPRLSSIGGSSSWPSTSQRWPRYSTSGSSRNRSGGFSPGEKKNTVNFFKSKLIIFSVIGVSFSARRRLWSE